MNEEYNNNSRIQSLTMRQELDRVPVIMNIGVYAAYISNISSYEYYTNPQKAYEVQLWAKKLHKGDGGLSYGVPSSDAENFGGELDLTSTSRISLPKVKCRVVETTKDVENLKKPDLQSSKYILKKLEFDRMLVENGHGVSVSSGSPMEVAVSIVGIELLMRWMYKEPELVHRVLRVATDYLLERAYLYIEEFGSDKCTATSHFPTDSHSLISPKMFEKYSLPYIVEIHKKLIAKQIKKWSIHLCGDHMKNLKYWINDIELYPRTLITIGEEMELENVAKVFGPDHMIGGNIKTSLFQLGSPNEIYRECEKVIKKMKHSPGGFILTPSCSLPPKASPINVNALLEAVNDFGRYD